MHTLTRAATLAAAPPALYRRVFVVVEAAVAVAGLGGVAQLLAGVATPPPASLPPWFESWTVPALWLLVTVPLPAAVAGVAAARNHPYAPVLVAAAAGTMALEVLVQIPFLGPHPLQAVFGGLALLLAGLAWSARRRGWRPVRAAESKLRRDG